MGFFDNYEDVGGGDWIDAAEKRVFLEEGIPFSIIAIAHEETNRFDQPRYICKVLAPDPEGGDEAERLIGFASGTVFSRDRMLEAMQQYLDTAEGENDPPVVKLDKIGQSYLLVPPDAETSKPQPSYGGGTGTRARRK